MATEAGPNPFTLPPVVKTLFKFFPGKTLCNAASVCRLWRSQAEMCLHQRQQYSWQYFDDDESSLTPLEKIQQYFEEDVGFRPCFVVVFMTTDLWDHIGRRSTGHKRKHGDSSSRKAWKCFCETVLPSGCQVFCSITSGIVGTTLDLSCTTEKDFGRCASILCFGQYPGLQVSLQKSRGDDRGICSKKPDQGSSDDVKLFLLMSCFAGASFTIDDIRRELPHALIVGGIITTSCVHGLPASLEINNHYRRCSTFPYCVVFRGRDLQVACVKLDDEITEESKADQVIRRLKDKTRAFPLGRSIAFMYACVARGYNLYTKHNVETSVFRRHFPSTPLLGLFGNGEIGCEYPFPSEGAGKFVDMQHAYTTFIAVVSLP